MQDQGKQNVSPVIRPKEILADWLVAVTEFYQFYQQLSLYIDSVAFSQTTYLKPKWIGQCPAHELQSLQDSMRTELEKLKFEMDRTGQRPIASRYKRLATHTLRLQEFNQQAGLLVQLALLPAS